MGKKKLKSRIKQLTEKNRRLFRALKHAERLLKAYYRENPEAYDDEDIDFTSEYPAGNQMFKANIDPRKAESDYEEYKEHHPLINNSSWEEVRNYLFLHGQSILRPLGDIIWKNIDIFNNPLYKSDNSIVNLYKGADNDNPASIISGWCSPINFIFDEVQISSSNVRLTVELLAYRTSLEDDRPEVLIDQVLVDIPLDNCKCPSHILKVIRQSIYLSMMDYLKKHVELFYDYGDRNQAMQIYSNNVSKYILGMFMVSRMLNDEEELVSEITNAFLINELTTAESIRVPSLSIMLNTMMFTNEAKTYCESNDNITVIAEGVAHNHETARKWFKTTMMGKSVPDSDEPAETDTDAD